MTFNISDLMDGLGDETLTLTDPGVTTPERVLALARERRGAASAAPVRHTKTKRPRRLGRILLIAAALTALLSVTAYAVYELVIDRYVIDQPAPYEVIQQVPASAEDPAEPVSPRSRISLVGYQGTPEYLAFTEWEAWQTANPVDWGALGVDDSYNEIDLSHQLYGCSFYDQAEALDAIMAKYGLTPHTTMATFNKTETLYDALGTEPFYTDAVAGASNGYIYDDGTFKDEGRRVVLSDGRAVDMTVFVSAKGSFSDISGTIDLSQGYDEWSYTTASGVTVDLILTANEAEILAETDGAYIDVSLAAGSAPSYDPATDPQLSEEQRAFYLEGLSQTRPDMTEAEMDAEWESYRESYTKRQQAFLPPAVTEAEVESIADCIGFDVLAERFDGTAHPETGEKVTALRQQMFAETETAQVEAEQAEADIQETTRTMLDELGSYTADMPEGYANVFTVGHRQQGRARNWTEQDIFDQMSLGWFSQSAMASINLDYYRFYTDEDRTGSATVEAFHDAVAYFVGKDYPLTEINGCQGFVLAENGMTAQTVWYDEARDLLFWLEGYDAGLDTEQTLALAKSVVEGTPSEATQAETAALAENVPPTPIPAD